MQDRILDRAGSGIGDKQKEIAAIEQWKREQSGALFSIFSVKRKLLKKKRECKNEQVIKDIQAFGEETCVEQIPEKGKIPLPIILHSKRFARGQEGGIDTNEAEKDDH